MVPQAGQEAVCLQALLAVPYIDAYSGKLEPIQTRLQPFLQPSRWCCRPVDIPLAIDNVSVMDLATILQEGWLPRDLTLLNHHNDLPRLWLTTVFVGAADLELPVQIHEILDCTDANVVIPTPLVRRLGRSVDLLFVDDATRTGRIRFSMLNTGQRTGRSLLRACAIRIAPQPIRHGSPFRHATGQCG
jgi:hypothetical protein